MADLTKGIAIGLGLSKDDPLLSKLGSFDYRADGTYQYQVVFSLTTKPVIKLVKVQPLQWRGSSGVSGGVAPASTKGTRRRFD